MVSAVKIPDDLVMLKKKGLSDHVLINPVDGGHSRAYDNRTRVSTASTVRQGRALLVPATRCRPTAPNVYDLAPVGVCVHTFCTIFTVPVGLHKTGRTMKTVDFYERNPKM